MEHIMWDRQSLSSLFTLLAGVAAAVIVIAVQPEPREERSAAPQARRTLRACADAASKADRAPCDDVAAAQRTELTQ
jgi:hypothetical protein